MLAAEADRHDPAQLWFRRRLGQLRRQPQQGLSQRLRRRERRVELHQQFIDGLARLIGTRSKQGRFACEVLVSGIITMVTTRIGAGDTAELRSLRKPLADLVRRALS